MRSLMEEIIKPQIENLQNMYRAGYEAGLAEGKRLAYKDISEQLKEKFPSCQPVSTSSL